VFQVAVLENILMDQNVMFALNLIVIHVMLIHAAYASLDTIYLKQMEILA